VGRSDNCTVNAPTVADGVTHDGRAA